MAELPIAPQSFSLGATPDPRAFSDAFQKTGSVMGMVAGQAIQGIQKNREQQLQAQQAQLEQQKFEEEKRKTDVTESLAKFGKMTDLYKNTHKSLRPRLWPEVAAMSNGLLGTKFDPSVMPPNADDSVDAAHNEIQLLLDKKQSYGDTLKKLAMIAATTDEETRKAVESARGFLAETPEALALKNDGKNTGTWDLKGYDPKSKKQIFMNSKAPMLTDSAGNKFEGPIQSKADLDKTTEAIRKLDGVEASVDELDALLGKIPSGAKGTWETAVASIPGGNLIYSQAAQYADQLPSIAVSFYRDATGDTRLSDNDAKTRALPFMPRPGESREVQVAKRTIIKSMLRRRKEALSQGVFEVPFDANDEEVMPRKSTGKLSPAARDVISGMERRK